MMLKLQTEFALNGLLRKKHTDAHANCFYKEWNVIAKFEKDTE